MIGEETLEPMTTDDEIACLRDDYRMLQQAFDRQRQEIIRLRDDKGKVYLAIDLMAAQLQALATQLRGGV